MSQPDILAGTVDDLEDALPEYDGDLDELLRAEKDGENRSTAVEAIEREMARRAKETGESGDEGGFDAEAVEEAVEEKTELTGMAAIRDRIQNRLSRGSDEEADVETSFRAEEKDWIRTGIPGFDDLFEYGIPKGSPILLAGGSGAGKTIFGLQTCAYHASHGDNVLYMSFEESVDALKSHMRSFGWDPDTLMDKGNLRIQKLSPFDINRKVEAVLAEEKGELMIDVDPVIIPEDFDPDIVVVDSLTAVASAFTGDSKSYRIYLDTLFNFFEEINATSFLITETSQEPENKFSPTGVEEFLADGVIVLYNIRRGDVREAAIEVLKMRGAKHKRRMVAMQITEHGMRVYPNQSVFGAMED